MDTVWSRRQESNLYLTLRRRVHYPLCYGEVGAYFSAMGCLAASFLSFRESLVQGSCGVRGRIAGNFVAVEISKHAY